MRELFAVEDNRASDDRRRWYRRSPDVGVIMDGWIRACKDEGLERIRIRTWGLHTPSKRELQQ